MKKGQRVIFIMGRERSGTSMLARILNIMGVNLGAKERLILETEYNVKGCWEHRPLLEISEMILKRFGGDSHTPPDFPFNWENDPRIADLETEARLIIEKDFKNADVWGWKDPRGCLTLPFWQKIIPDIEYIIVIRNPEDVVKSELRMSWISSFSKGMYLWLKFNAAVAKHTEGKHRLFVFYEDFFDKDWRQEIRRLAEFLGTEYVKSNPKYEQEIEAFIAKDLRHSATRVLEFLGNPDVPYAVKTYYFLLKQFAKDENQDLLKELLDARPSQVINTLSRFADLDAIGALNLYKVLAEKDKALADKDRALAEKDRALAEQCTEQNRQIADKDKALAEKDRALAEKDRALAEKDRALADLEAQVQALKNSLSWKVTAPMRVLLKQIKKISASTSR